MMVAGAVVVAGMLACRRHMFRHHAHCGCGPHEAHGESCTCEKHGDGESCGCHSHHAEGRWGSRFARRFWLRALLFKLDATPAQEKDIEVILDEFDKHVGEAKSLFESSRQAAARAIEGDVFDDGAMGEAQAKAAEASSQMKNAFEAMLRRVHSVLDKEQRTNLAKLLAQGRRGWWHRCSHHEC